MVTKATKQKIKDGFKSALIICTLLFTVGYLIGIGYLGGYIGQNRGIPFIWGSVIALGIFFSLVGIFIGIIMFKNWLDKD